MELPRRYPYNPSWRAIVACAAFFGACSAFMAYQAAHNTAGVDIEGIIELGPAGATVFYWVMAALCGGFLLMAFLLAVRRIASPQMIELGTDALLLPSGRFQKRTSRIAYADIQNVSEVQVSGQKFLYVIAGGLKYTLTASLLPDTESYLAVRDFLASHASRHPTVPGSNALRARN